MNFKNQTHRIYFAKAVAPINQNDRTLLAAVYLLTADNRLWQNVKKHVHYKEIRFEYICLSGSTENGYTLFCCARDIYMGSKHLKMIPVFETYISVLITAAPDKQQPKNYAKSWRKARYLRRSSFQPTKIGMRILCI